MVRKVIFRQWDPVVKIYRNAYGLYDDEKGVFMTFDETGILRTAFPTDWENYVMKLKWVLEIYD